MTELAQKEAIMFLNRDIKDTVMRFSKFPVVGIFGPRQSGKTTLCKNLFKNHVYLNFENPEILEFVTQDPKGFLQKYENEHGIIVDEFQHFPQFLSYVQIEADEKKRPGYFVLTGSQNFLMNAAVSQSLAGRIGILTLLPLSINECAHNNLLDNNVNEMIVKGFYPRIYTENFIPDELYPSDIATNCGITQKTADHWISILQASYIVFLLQPHHGNFNKRITKSAKLYFYDTGIACSLLGIKSITDLEPSPFRGHLFECFIIADLFKQYLNKGTNAPLYFWRDRNGLIEVDCLVEHANKLTPIEIKSGQTIVADFFTSLKKWNELAQTNPEDGFIIYGGQESQKRSVGTVVGWQEAGNIVDIL